MEYTFCYSSPMGRVTLASNGEALTGLWFEGQKYYAATLEKEHEEKTLPVFAQTVHWLDIYFSGERPDFTPPLRPKGSSFQQAVWAILLTIPYGQTMSYGQIANCVAAERGLPHMSARAVGAAVGRNPISLIIPCHRVLGANGSLTGYAGGLDRKRQLLQMEQRQRI